jgi:hypothetical protein
MSIIDALIAVTISHAINALIAIAVNHQRTTLRRRRQPSMHSSLLPSTIDTLIAFAVNL